MTEEIENRPQRGRPRVGRVLSVDELNRMNIAIKNMDKWSRNLEKQYEKRQNSKVKLICRKCKREVETEYKNTKKKLVCKICSGEMVRK